MKNYRYRKIKLLYYEFTIERRRSLNLIWTFIKFIFYTGIIVAISKYLLVPVLRKLGEGLNLKPKTIGNVAGIATSTPELLTVCFSSFTGLISASAYNIISSNIINLVQYLFTVYINKNQKVLANRAIKIDLIMVALTIAIPACLFIFNIEYSVEILPIFILLFLAFYVINNNSHKLYLKRQTVQEKEIQEETKWVRGKIKIIIKYTVYLVIIAILLYTVGNLLSDTLEALCINFKIPQWIIGILLGFITSVPELITFLEAQKHYKKEKQAEDGVIEATNNLLTSNIFNLFVIQSVGIIIFAIFL